MLEKIELLLNNISNFVWGFPMIFLLMGTHIFLTFKLKNTHRFIIEGIKFSFGKKKEGEGEISHFGALTTALAATVGTGNIAGVATAIACGGPGAVFWMWLTGVFGIATKYAEALLSVKYRVINKDGSVSGGPMYVLENALKSKPLGILFAFFTMIAAFGIGNTVQSNSISIMLNESFHINKWVVGIIMAILTAMVILGGIKTIAKACEKLVPIMAISYIFSCILLMIIFYKELIPSLLLILKSAFTGQAAIGGFIGAQVKNALRYGIARGLFSNESGMGSAPIVAAAAKTKKPIEQALVSSTGTFWDTVVICALTGIVIVASGKWTNGKSGVALTKDVFSQLPFIGEYLLAFSLFTFVFSTILGWSYYGEKATEYLFGKKAILPYRYLWVIAVLLGAVLRMPVVWSFADIANALMALPNLLSLLLLHKVVVLETQQYFSESSQEKDCH